MFDIQSFYEAKSVKDAIEALAGNENAYVISGGTDVLIRVREGKDAGCSLVSIHNIPEIKGGGADRGRRYKNRCGDIIFAYYK